MYKVQTQTQSRASNTLRLVIAVLAIATVFVTFFYLTQAVMTAVYGYDFANSKAYQETVLVTKNATDQTEGYGINSYVQYVKGEICPTLHKNITAESECMNL